MTNISQRKNISYLGAGIILTRTGPHGEHHYLLLKGRDTGVWSFSKGHSEVSDCESPLRTAVRETYEETGLRAGRDYHIMGDSIRFGKRPYWVGLVTAESIQVSVNRNEHTMAAWFSWEEICKLNANTDNEACQALGEGGSKYCTRGMKIRMVSYPFASTVNNAI